MTGEVLRKREFGDNLVDSSNENASGHGARAVGVFEREEVIILFWGVYLEVVLQGVLWADGSILLGPKMFLPFSHVVLVQGRKIMVSSQFLRSLMLCCMSNGLM